MDDPEDPPPPDRSKSTSIPPPVSIMPIDFIPITRQNLDGIFRLFIHTMVNLSDSHNFTTYIPILDLYYDPHRRDRGTYFTTIWHADIGCFDRSNNDQLGFNNRIGEVLLCYHLMQVLYYMKMI